MDLKMLRGFHGSRASEIGTWASIYGKSGEGGCGEQIVVGAAGTLVFFRIRANTGVLGRISGLPIADRAAIKEDSQLDFEASAGV